MSEKTQYTKYTFDFKRMEKKAAKITVRNSEPAKNRSGFAVIVEEEGKSETKLLFNDTENLDGMVIASGPYISVILSRANIKKPRRSQMIIFAERSRKPNS